MRTVNNAFKILVILVPLFYGYQGHSQSYDQLKVKLQLENYYGTRLKPTSPNSNLSGSQYLYEDWLPIEIEFEAGSVEFNQGKIDLSNSGVEVVYKEKEMYVSPSHFKSIQLLNQNRWFVPGNKYFYEDMALQGVVELFSAKPEPPFILEQHYLYVKEPSLNGYVNGGSMDRKLVKTSALFLHDGTRLIKIKGKQSLGKFYKDQHETFDALRKQLGTDFTNSRSVQLLVDSMKAEKSGK